MITERPTSRPVYSETETAVLHLVHKTSAKIAWRIASGIAFQRKNALGVNCSEFITAYFAER
jgi:hypothetical protein